VTAVPGVDNIITSLEAAVSDSLGEQTLKDIVLSVEK